MQHMIADLLDRLEAPSNYKPLSSADLEALLIDEKKGHETGLKEPCDGNRTKDGSGGIAPREKDPSILKSSQDDSTNKIPSTTSSPAVKPGSVVQPPSQPVNLPYQPASILDSTNPYPGTTYHPAPETHPQGPVSQGNNPSYMGYPPSSYVYGPPPGSTQPQPSPYPSAAPYYPYPPRPTH